MRLQENNTCQRGRTTTAMKIDSAEVSEFQEDRVIGARLAGSRAGVIAQIPP